MGWLNSENQWLACDHLTHTPDLVEEFHRMHPHAPGREREDHPATSRRSGLRGGVMSGHTLPDPPPHHTTPLCSLPASTSSSPFSFLPSVLLLLFSFPFLSYGRPFLFPMYHRCCRWDNRPRAEPA